MTDFLYRRLAYHLDGTQVFLLGGFTSNYSDKPDVFTEPPNDWDPRDFDPTALEAMNRLDGNRAYIKGTTRTGLLFLFPTPMHIRGILPFVHGPGLHLWYSQDAAEFADGTWYDMGIVPQIAMNLIPDENLSPPGAATFDADIRQLPDDPNTNAWDRRIAPTYPDEGRDNVGLRHQWWPGYLGETKSALSLGTLWREVYTPATGGVVPYDMRQVTALKFIFDPKPNYDHIYVNLYLYGGPELDAWRNYMQVQDENFHDATYAAQLDWGRAPWNSSADKGIRIKNRSPTHTANDIEVYFDPGHLVIPYVQADMFVLSLDGVSWTSKVTIASLGPNSLSTVIKIRRVTIAGDDTGPTQALIRTDVGEWITGYTPPRALDAFGTVAITSNVPRKVPASGTVAVTSHTAGAVSG